MLKYIKLFEINDSQLDIDFNSNCLQNKQLIIEKLLNIKHKTNDEEIKNEIELIIKLINN